MSNISLSRLPVNAWLRVLVEIALISGFLFFLLPQTLHTPMSEELTPATLFLIICCSYWGAVRLPWGKGYGVEFGHLLVVGTAVCLGIAPTILLLDKWPIQVENDAGLGNILIVFILTDFVYLNFRITIWFWRQWNDLRKKRLLWSYTHTQILLVFLAIMFLLVTSGISSAVQANNGEFSPKVLLTYLLNSLVEILPLFAAAAFSTLFFVVIFALPLVFVSYLLTRTTIGRLEDLTASTAELRAGDLTTRVTVTGEDEVAQLQDNFNQMAADLEKTVAELEQERDRVAGLLKVQHELTASVSHELRTPIATIQGYLQPAIERLSDSTDAATQKDLEIIAGETERLRQLIDDLFALSRAEVDQLTLNIQATDVTVIAQRIVEIWQPLAWQQQKVDVVHQSESGAHIALVDGSRLEQILTNLVHNGTRHTPPGGIVAVSTSANDQWIIIEVKDTGEGIAPDALPFIWQPFYRGEANGRSSDRQTGLGLALVKTMTEAMGGQVHVTSQLGVGSCFQIQFPKT